MSTQSDRNYNFVQGDIIEQEGYFVTGVDKSNKSTTYNVGQAGAVGSHAQNIVYDQQVLNQNKVSLQDFLQSLRSRL